MEDNRAAFLLEFAGRALYGDEYARMLAADFSVAPHAMERLLADKHPPTERQVDVLGERMRFRAAGLIAIAKELEEMTKAAPPPPDEGNVVSLRPGAAPVSPRASSAPRRKMSLVRSAAGRLRSSLRSYERLAMRVAVVLLAVSSAGAIASLVDVRGRLQEATASLELPRVHATVIPGVPAALGETWQKATAQRSGDLEAETWLTARIENVGYFDVGDLSVRLQADAEIREIFAYSYTGQVMGDDPAAPKVVDGGVGGPTVSIRLPALPPTKEHWLFFGLEKPVTPASATAKSPAPADPRQYLRTLTIEVKKPSAPNKSVTSTIYGWAVQREIPTVHSDAPKNAG